jgi:hypothetical protein
LKCLITGIETNNKWRNHPLCRDIVDLAKVMKAEDPSFCRLTMRQALVKLDEQWRARVEEEAQKQLGDK